MNALKIFKQADFNRRFEYLVAEKAKNKIVKSPVYISVGTEHIPVCIESALSDNLIQDYSIFAQHRCHSYYLTFIKDPVGLMLELCGCSSGCNQGMGGSASISGKEKGIKMWGHSGLLGDQVPIGVGYAHASQEITVVVLGDAAAEEDYVLGALGYAATKKAPVIFICEDNDLSILTKKEVRRSWNISDVAKGFGIRSHDIYDNPRDIYRLISTEIKNLPVLLNINCKRHLWHAGSGNDGEPDWDYLTIFESEYVNASSSEIDQEEGGNLEDEVKEKTRSEKIKEITLENRKKIDIIWKRTERLLKL